MALFGSVWAVTASPWLVRNALQTGNPVYPVLADRIPTTVPFILPPGSRGTKYERSLTNLALLSYRQTFDGGFHGGPANALPLSFLALLPFVGLARRSWRLWGILGAHVLVAYLLLFHVAPHETRYALPLYTWLALAAAGALMGIADRISPRARLALLAAAAVPFLISARFGAYELKPRVPVLLGRESHASFLARHVPGWQMLRYIEGHLPRDAKILNLHANFYYLSRDCFIGSPYQRSSLMPVWPAGRPEVGWQAWDRLGIGYVLIPTGPRRTPTEDHLIAYHRWSGFREGSRPPDDAEVVQRLCAWLPGYSGSPRAGATAMTRWYSPQSPRAYDEWREDPGAGVAASLHVAAVQGRMRLIHRSPEGWYLFKWCSSPQMLAERGDLS